jgi:hypothetical protein
LLSAPDAEAIENADAPIDTCPGCGGTLNVQFGKLFVHRWCSRGGCFDSWRAMNGMRLSQTDASVVRRQR